METLKNILQSFNAENRKPIIKASSSKLVKTIVVIATLTSIAFLLPSCMVGFRTSGHERRGGNTTEQHDGGERHNNNGGHDNDKNHDRDNHRD